MSRKKLYWFSQIYGWLLFLVLTGIVNQLNGRSWDLYLVSSMGLTFVLGIFFSHQYRNLIVRLDWLRLSIGQLIPRFILACILFGTAFFFVYTFISDLLIHGVVPEFEWLDSLEKIINLIALFIFWSLLYFLFHFIQNYRKEEIKNLRWQAAKNEIELNKLKSQLNPHFIFNSMNSIRALVDENPQKSKDSITRLSNILRSSLLMGKKQVISFREEMQLVNDYLALERTRFEERLKITLNIPEHSFDFQVPPMMIQTLVENGIKHGISKLPQGGSIQVDANVVDDLLHVKIKNSGNYAQPSNSDTRFGLVNTRQRLQLIYGDRAEFSIRNETDNCVIAELIIPTERIQYKTQS